MPADASRCLRCLSDASRLPLYRLPDLPPIAFPLPLPTVAVSRHPLAASLPRGSSAHSATATWTGPRPCGPSVSSRRYATPSGPRPTCSWRCTDAPLPPQLPRHRHPARPPPSLPSPATFRPPPLAAVYRRPGRLPVARKDSESLTRWVQRSSGTPPERGAGGHVIRARGSCLRWGRTRDRGDAARQVRDHRGPGRRPHAHHADGALP
jgi:hypothetical protein